MLGINAVTLSITGGWSYSANVWEVGLVGYFDLGQGRIVPPTVLKCMRGVTFVDQRGRIYLIMGLLAQFSPTERKVAHWKGCTPLSAGA